MAKDQTRRRILEAAGPVFAEKGYDAATVREICARAGVNLAAVNYYFGSKEQLYVETLQYGRDPEGEHDQPLTWPADATPEEKLRVFIEGLVRQMLGERAPWHRRLMLREILQPTGACRQLVERHFRARMDQLLGILDEILPPEVPLSRRQQIAFSIVGQALYYRVASEIVKFLVDEDQRQAHFGVDPLAAHILDFTLAALGLRPGLAVPRAEVSQEPLEP